MSKISITVDLEDIKKRKDGSESSRTVQIRESVHKRLRRYAVDKDLKVVDITTELIDNLLNKEGY
ncbi:hypothetical protein GPK34_00820 [Secundilactobacillus kimchicus]|uniref:hypothetical protein n=1 Tax=Secundilactobacillus kimchicus TaxID=528209 RepID=UPI001C00B5C3|nr:hypothetical protein [Secundilactobacillus kimchicus]MBT9670581.1 hypothetical protein [Secundilactobacillus kimchicus]